MHRTAIALLVCLLVTGEHRPAHSQPGSPLPGDTLARVGDAVITVRDLTERIELMPFPGPTQTLTPAEVVRKALYAMIAEKLLGREAKRIGLRGDAPDRLMDHELENLFIRDALFRREVSAKVHIPREEIAAGMARASYELKVISFLVENRRKGDALARALRQANPASVPDSIPAEIYTQRDTVTIRFGTRDTAYENAAFSIGSSRVSRPFLSQNVGWGVLWLLDRMPDEDIVKRSPAERRQRVERIVRDRHEAVLAEKYYFGVLQSQSARADERMFAILADSISGLLMSDTATFRRNDGYLLSSDLVTVLIGRMPPYLDSVLIRMAGGTMTMGEILEMLRYEDFLFRSPSGQRFRVELNEEVKNLVARELLARKGRAEGLLVSDAVQKDLRVWTDYLSAGALQNLVRDTVTVTDDELLDFFLASPEVFGDSYEVNVQEVLCRTTTDAAEVIGEMQRGKTFSEVAATRSTRVAWAPRNGISGFFHVGEHPGIGYRALLADSGAMVGPVQVPEGVSMFTVLATRKTPRGAAPFDDTKERVRERLVREKRGRTLDRFIARLARKENVVIGEETLKNVKVSIVPMFTRRFIGFGGRMTAVPLLMQEWDWVKEMKSDDALP